MKKSKILRISNLASLLAAVALLMLASCTKNGASAPTSNGISPDSAAGGAVLTVTGSGLANMRTIVFDKNNVPAAFNPTFNTDNAVLFRVPDTAYGGQQNIILTNADGKQLKIPFTVIALATVSSANIYEFSTGSQITLNGNNLDNVTTVLLHGSATTATIVNKSRKQLVITMPSTTLTRAKLDITNASGTITTQQEFISVDNALQFYTEGFGPGMQDWSWDNSSQSTDFAILGTHSLKEVYAAGNWAALSFHSDNAIPASNYTYLTFWAKGGSADVQVNVQTENGGGTTTVTIPANVWTYFKLPIAGWINGVNVVRLDFQMQGPNGGVDQTIYYDDILFVK